MTCPTGFLVDIDPSKNTTDFQSESCLFQDSGAKEPITCKSSNDYQSVEEKNLIIENSSVKLNGFLTKIQTTGILKTSKSRWFSFDSSTCDLYYYRSDSINDPPLGKIPVRHASFNFTAENLKENIFSITAEGVTHILQAQSKQALLWWLQELQAQRRKFNASRPDFIEHDEWHGKLLGQSLFWVPTIANLTTHPGLLGTAHSEKKKPLKDNDHDLKLNILPRVEGPPEIPCNKTIEKSRSFSAFSTHGLSVQKLSEVLKMQASKFRGSNSGRHLPHSTAADPTSSMDKISEKVTNYSAVIATMQDNIQKLNEELDLVKTKLRSKEEAVQLLKLELENNELLQIKLKNEHTFSRDDYKLRSEVIGLKLDKERLEEENNMMLVHQKELQEQVSLMKQKMVIKDEVLVQLGNQVSDLENLYKSLQCEYNTLKKEKNEEFVVLTPTTSDESYSDLKDRADGYLLQNKFLNNEILELANLRQMDARRIQHLCEKSQHSEAEYCQLHSKYLILLSEMNKPRSESVGLVVTGTQMNTLDDERKEMMKILIDDALKDAKEVSGNALKSSNRREKYDQFGFNNLPDDDTESTLLAAANYLDKEATNILHSSDQYKASVAVKWQNYLTINKELQRNDEVKSLIRLGVPHELRHQVWLWMVNLVTLSSRQKLDVTSSYYQQLVNSEEVSLTSKQIELDLLRTLPNNKYFSSLSSLGIEQLRRVLRAYSVHNPSIGYCQGLNRIAAVALLYLNEEEAFWCLVAVIECLMPEGYYSSTLSTSQADQRVVRDLMNEKLPKLHKHLESVEIDTSLITFNWLLCIYCDNVPPEMMLHIWDCFLYEGSKVLFRFALAFFKYVEEEILELSDYMAIFNFLRNMSHRMHDVRGLSQIAFTGMNPFPKRRIQRLRQHHLEKVLAELKELDDLRKGYTCTRRESEVEIDSDDE